MKKLLLVLVCGLLLGGCTVRNPFNKKPAGLEITTLPVATVFLNGEEVGTTPYTDRDLAVGDYQVKLVPQGEDSFIPWETQLTLHPAVTTIVSYNFAEAETDATSYILELRQEAGDGTYLSVISEPDTVNLTIDGKPTGYTPAAKLDSTPGAHQLNLTSPGYKPLDLSVNAVKGYNLIVNVKLSSDPILLTSPPPVASGSAQTDPEPVEGLSSGITTPYVLIQETGTGWLRVRREPSSSGEELGKVNVGEKLKYLGETSDTGWHQVEFEGEEGWLSAKYTKLVK